MDKRWSKAEIAHLKRHAASHSVEKLAQRFRTDVGAVRAKLDQLGLSSDQSASRGNAVELFRKAMESLYARKWTKATKAFEEVATTAHDQHLADRARQFLAICEGQTASANSDGDPYDLAVLAKNDGDLDTALELCEKHGEIEKDERFAYLAASIHALAGDHDQALSTLETAIRLEPKNRVHAYLDPDFESLDSVDDFANLTSS